MPTGYTAEIIEGKISTFKEFAQKCMRAFGATIHMRDESLDKKYVPREVEKYYIESVKECEEELESLKKSDDSFFAKKIREQLEEDYVYYQNKLSGVLKSKRSLESILEDAKNWNPPTDEHTGIKDFMIEQLEETLRHDGDPTYHQKELEKIREKLESPIDVSEIRSQMIKDAEEDLERAKERLAEEIKRCEDSNKWAKEFLKSIE